MVGKDEAESKAASNQSNSQEKTYKDIATSIEHGNVYKIVLNRPKKLNAITVVVKKHLIHFELNLINSSWSNLNFKMYNELISALKEAEENPNITMCVITGAGDYYCSGNDLTNFSTKEAMQNIKKAAIDGGILLE